MPLKNIIEELDLIEPVDKYLFVESKANHAIVAAINVIQLIQENFNQQDADELCRRFINSVKGKNPMKFHRKIHQLRENRNAT